MLCVQVVKLDRIPLSAVFDSKGPSPWVSEGVVFRGAPRCRRCVGLDHLVQLAERSYCPRTVSPWSRTPSDCRTRTKRNCATVLMTLFANLPEQFKLWAVDATSISKKSRSVQAVCHTAAPSQFAVSCGGHFHRRTQESERSLLRSAPPQQFSQVRFHT